MAVLWCDGEWRVASDFSVSASDRGVLHGLAAFETMLAIDGVIQHAPKHFLRLAQAVARLGLADVSRHDFSSIAAELCAKNYGAEGRMRLRLTVTSGAGALSEKGPSPHATAWMTATPVLSQQLVERVVTLPWTRNERSALTGIKSSSYAENVLGLQWAQAQGAEEGIFFNTRDELCEACTANVFVRWNGTWHTPRLDSGCLPGVMREVVLEQNPRIEESIITREQWSQAEAVFLTSAIRGIVPVLHCDGRNLPHCGPE
jgi:branched-subunit amino acid aminotransferase/4-amino-4-deoxychorismate lyase